jgi:hypothetical protein
VDGTATTSRRPALLALIHGPTALLGHLLADLPGVEQASVYGSWAARYLGEAGPIPVASGMLDQTGPS